MLESFIRTILSILKLYEKQTLCTVVFNNFNKTLQIWSQNYIVEVGTVEEERNVAVSPSLEGTNISIPLSLLSSIPASSPANSQAIPAMTSSLTHHGQHTLRCSC